MGERTAELPDLSEPRRVHLIGAGGAGMSAIGEVLIGMGHHVSGSDAAASPALDRLRAAGADVHVGHDETWLHGVEVVARSTAIPPDNVEVVAAQDRGLTVWRRAELLASICARRRTVAVSGTHGKTTTSAILAVVLRAAGLHPSMIVGGEIAGIGSGASWDPRGEWMIVEADESDGTFLALAAEAVVVTSVEPDHLDFYGSEAALRDSFDRFVDEAPGPAVLCADDPFVARIAVRARSAGSQVTTYGTGEGVDLRIVDFTAVKPGSTFGLETESGVLGPVSLAVPGVHNARNAAAAVAMANALGVPWGSAIAAVAGYTGVARRYEHRGERDGVTFIDDYGHLPTEVASTIAAAGSGGWERIVAVFQPHRYSRTEALWREFGDSFVGSDVIVITDVYSAGEETRPGVSGELVVKAVLERHPESEVHYVPEMDRLPRELWAILRPGDLCLTLGAGDLTKLPDEMLASGPRT